MIIQQISYGKNFKYKVCNSIQDTGAKDPDTIVAVENLTEATAVLKYLRGDEIPVDVAEIALNAIKKADAHTVERKRTRQAK